MSLTKEEIKKIAELARLELNDVEISKYQNQLGSVLDYIDMLKEADCSDLDILGLDLEDNFNRTREDQSVNWPEDEIKIALEQVNEKENGQVKVNRVM
ncbi:MAG TPA: Asp-tRNA(Asn)/Glu-tRNA(Gln) amidotransferase subunit GatC [bacterium]|nr:Asp-tRNA(Asn)/Glu-tRNA(Gln) amidotransferase subunit GatC [bacterium]